MAPISARKVGFVDVRFVEVRPCIRGPFAEGGHVFVSEEGGGGGAGGGVVGGEDNGDDYCEK